MDITISGSISEPRSVPRDRDGGYEDETLEAPRGKKLLAVAEGETPQLRSFKRTGEDDDHLPPMFPPGMPLPLKAIIAKKMDEEKPFMERKDGRDDIPPPMAAFVKRRGDDEEMPEGLRGLIRGGPPIGLEALLREERLPPREEGKRSPFDDIPKGAMLAIG